ncbi:protein ANTAGONIST OF LIKE HETEROCHROMATIN PROTEIN 1 [Selaginella moellendorffii]|nr:protein ANTAGONIST OF LIKE HETEROCHROMATIN PROTEIN 1 [Selaginella moellendorffii]XP_024535564.1 protein ANTAGONIST OF LIKE HETEROCHROMATIN PROTEIN 1 [Selaginella moellendorffii]|eukprot:XP_002975150.2 protein ANTAGONIST OF LIKE HETEROCHROMATIN PROTEIN 1 [Selaginella moellendorffii]
MSGSGGLEVTSRKRPWNPRRSELLKMLLFLVVYSEQQQQEEEEFERRSRLEWQRIEEEHKRRVELMLDYHRHLQEEYAELDELERLRLKRSRLAVAAVGAAIATQQSVHRRLWVKSRSQAWWERCNHPSFPEAEFHRAFRMSKSTFNIICDQLGLAVAKEDTMLRQAIPVRQRVAVCIWRLATGEPLRLVSKRFGLGISTCHKLVLEVCAAINDVLLSKYVQWPTEERLQAVMEEFEAISGIPNLVGAMYTTHIPIIAPKMNVAAYFNKRHTDRNQKTSYSITLQGVVDIRGIFTDLSIGWPGSMSDERILEKSNLAQRAADGLLNGVWVSGGPGYPLLSWLLVPYTQHNLGWAHHAFNEKLSEVLKIARDAFGRLKGRWKFLQKRTEVKLQELPAVLGACSVLHNVCEHHNEGFDEELAYEAVDDLMFPDSSSSDPAAVQARDAIAHNLLHSGATFL